MVFIVRTRPSQFSDEPLREGLTHAACVDVIDLGMQPGLKGVDVHKCKLVFETPHRDSKGKPMRVTTWPYTVAFGKKANLRKDLERWRGRAFTDAELAGFDLDGVIGAAAMLNVVHRQKDGKTYSNIDGIFPDRSKDKYTPDGSYIRAERKVLPAEQHAAEHAGLSDYNDEEEVVPF